MITPRFSLDQDDTFLIIKIRAPYCDLKELEIYVDNNDFRFVCSPYYLRLNLPGNIIENDSATGQFLCEKGEFIYKFEKETKGEHFKNLQFLTSLLNVRKKSKKPVNIEIISSQLNKNNSVYSDDDETDWSIEQRILEQKIVMSEITYGFANKKTGILDDVEDQFESVFDNRNVHTIGLSERRDLKFDTEKIHFASEHFLADYFEDSLIQEIMMHANPWSSMKPESIAFNEKEQDFLKDLPNIEYLLTNDEIKQVLYGLIDILYAYCYDQRITNFEGNCESGWTITKLSSTLSWLDVFSAEEEVLVACFRRVMIYPLYRNFELAKAVLEDLKILLNLGQTFIVKCLINIYNIFVESDDPRYILNELYIKDYIIYMQKCPKESFELLMKNMGDISFIDEDDLMLNLSQIIEQEFLKDNTQIILEKMAKLKLSHSGDGDSDDSISETNEVNLSNFETAPDIFNLQNLENDTVD